MSDDARPKYDWGRHVRAAVDLYNDGTFPDRGRQELLVNAGDRGEVVQVGAHVESETTVYLVAFSDKLVLGCLEEEIEPA